MQACSVRVRTCRQMVNGESEQWCWVQCSAQGGCGGKADHGGESVGSEGAGGASEQLVATECASDAVDCHGHFGAEKEARQGLRSTVQSDGWVRGYPEGCRGLQGRSTVHGGRV